MRQKVSVPFMLLAILFNVCLIAANLFETKVVRLWGVDVTGGLMVFPLSYIINDCLTEVWGYRKTRLVIWSGFASNFLVAGMGMLACAVPAAPYWEGAAHFNFVFGMMPRIALASLSAFLVGSFLNAWVMSRMKVACKGAHFSWRAIASTVLGESADSLVFFPIAFGGMMAFPLLLRIMLVQILLKTLYELLALPFTIRLVKVMKRAEGSDAYDSGISYNIFRVKDL